MSRNFVSAIRSAREGCESRQDFQRFQRFADLSKLWMSFATLEFKVVIHVAASRGDAVNSRGETQVRVENRALLADQSASAVHG